MTPTPAQPDRVIAAVRQHNSQLPWEVDISRANQKIYDLWAALEWAHSALTPFVSDKAFVMEAISIALASAQKWED